MPSWQSLLALVLSGESRQQQDRFLRDKLSVPSQQTIEEHPKPPEPRDPELGSEPEQATQPYSRSEGDHLSARL